MLTTANIAELCRICLRQLLQINEQQQHTEAAAGTGGRNSYNANSLPHLAYLLQHFLAIDVLRQPSIFPQQICNLCCTALVHFQQLCAVAQQSTETLEGLTNTNNAKDDEDIDVKYSVITAYDETLSPQPAQVRDIETIVEDETASMSNAHQQNDGDNDDDDDPDIGSTRLNRWHHVAGNDDGSRSASTNALRKRKLLACQQCGKQAYKLPYLEAHIRSVHEGHSKPFLCRDCDKAFTRYEQLRSHMRNTHPDSSAVSASDENSLEQQLICEHCNRKYSTKNALGEHLKRHAQHKPHVCTHCGAAKVTRTELLTHLRIHNPNWENFKCAQCPQLFRHKSALSRHVRVVHEGERRFQCVHCQKRFGTHASQLRHERLHTGLLPHRCEVCSKCFADLGHLSAHMRAHDRALWPYSCAHCAKPCITRQNLVTHEQRHRGSKPYICAICSRGFTTDALLTQHSQLPCADRERSVHRGGNANEDNNDNDDLTTT